MSARPPSDCATSRSIRWPDKSNQIKSNKNCQRVARQVCVCVLAESGGSLGWHKWHWRAWPVGAAPAPFSQLVSRPGVQSITGLAPGAHQLSGLALIWRPLAFARAGRPAGRYFAPGPAFSVAAPSACPPPGRLGANLAPCQGREPGRFRWPLYLNRRRFALGRSTCCATTKQEPGPSAYGPGALIAGPPGGATSDPHGAGGRGRPAPAAATSGRLIESPSVAARARQRRRAPAINHRAAAGRGPGAGVIDDPAARGRLAPGRRR